jgi:UPF0271 protein
MPTIDLNCDMGESFGAWKMGNDAELMNFATSVNIACGFHAGDPSTIRKTVELAIEKGMAIGAHPSYPDLQGFGRRNMSLSANEVYDVVLYQVSALKGVCEASGAVLHHVKPHGALYNQAAGSTELSNAIARAVRSIDAGLFLYGLSGSLTISEAEKLNVRTASEAFADRTYQADGTLTPRSKPNALISDRSEAVSQALGMILEGRAISVSGAAVQIKADTICLHCDGEHAVDLARALREAFADNDVEVKAP